jgi:hypothetical protein
MLPQGLVPVEVGGGGDCQFLSIRHQLQHHLSPADLQPLGSPLTDLEVRGMAVDGFERLVASESIRQGDIGAMLQEFPGRRIQQHLTLLRERGAWGSEETIWGASFELTARLGRPVHINVFSRDGARTFMPDGAENYAEVPQRDDNVITLNLWFVNGFHY